MERIKSFIKKIYKMIIRPEMKILPGQLAFFLVLSIIPIIVLIGFICSTIHISLNNLQVLLYHMHPIYHALKLNRFHVYHY